MQKNSKNEKTSSRLHFNTKRVRTGRKIEKKKISFLSVQTRHEIENSKINAKKFYKLKNIIQALFQDETSQDMPKNKEEKKIPSYPYEPDPS